MADETITRHESTTSSATAETYSSIQASEEYVQISEAITSHFDNAGELTDPDLKKTIKSCHRSFERCIEYFHYSHKAWSSKASNSIENSYRQSQSSARHNTKIFLERIHKFKTESVSLKESEEDEPSKATLRKMAYDFYRNELTEIQRRAKDIQKDIERYLKFLKSIHLLFLSKNPMNFEMVQEAMELNSKIVVTWLETLMASRCSFHAKAIREYKAAFTSDYDRANFMTNLDSQVRTAAEDFVTSFEKIVSKFHGAMEELCGSLKQNWQYSKILTSKKLIPAMTSLYDRTAGKLKKESASVMPSRNQSEDRILEFRRSIERTAICVKVSDDVDSDDSSSMNSESYSVVTRKFSIRKKFETTQSSTAGRSFKTLVNKSRKLFESKVKSTQNDEMKSRKSLKSSVEITQDGLEDWLKRLYKKSKDDLGENRKRASMYLKYQAEQFGRSVETSSSDSLKKYESELKKRTLFHSSKLREFSKTLSIFFQLTNKEIHKGSKRNILQFSETNSIIVILNHKAQVCNCIFSVFQAQLAKNAERGLVKLTALSEGLVFKDKLNRSVLEFISGLRWIDHDFFRRIALSAEDSLKVLKNYSSVGKPSPFSGQELLSPKKTTAGDIEETVEVVSLLFEAFLRSQKIPTEEERIEEKLKQISSSNSNNLQDSSVISFSGVMTKGENHNEIQNFDSNMANNKTDYGVQPSHSSVDSILTGS